MMADVVLMSFGKNGLTNANRYQSLCMNNDGVEGAQAKIREFLTLAQNACNHTDSFCHPYGCILGHTH
jgi:hypothetical protein